MRRILLVLAAVLATSAAHAACTSPISSLNSTGATITLGATVDASNNCWGGTAIVDGTAAANKAVVSAAGALKVDGSAVTQPVSAASLPLPTGAMGSTGGTVGIVAGAALIGKVGIDQTTPGTTNGVQINAALPAGTNLIGKFGIDQTTPGTTNGVQVNAALPAGTNVIGHIICDSGCSGSGGTSSNFGSAFPAAGTAIGLTNGTNMVAWSATSNYGTAPSTIAVPAVNAFVTNSLTALVNNADSIAPVSAVTSTAGNSPVNSYLFGFDGTNFDRVRVNTSGQPVVVGAGVAGTPSGGVLTIQGVASMTKLLVTPDSVALPANQSVNVAQFGGVSTVTGQVAVSTAPVTATNTALVVDLRPDSPGIIATGGATTANSVPMVLNSQYPVNSVTTAPQPVTATATGTTAATVATIPAVASKTAYICGFTITADATALAVGTAVVSGTISGSLSYLQGVQAVTSGAGNLTQTFSPCIPASAANTAIVVTSAAAGTGGNTIVNAQGYYL